MPTAQAVMDLRQPETLPPSEWLKAISTDQAADWTEPALKTQTAPCVQKRPDFSLELEAEIERASRIVELENDWDGEGSLAYSKEVLARAVDFLTLHLWTVWNIHDFEPPIPKIGPGPDGSIDIHWKQPTWELLVNVPADEREDASFYGDNYGTQKISGSLNVKKYNLGIETWLMTR